MAMRLRVPVQINFDQEKQDLVVWADLNRNGAVEDGEIDRRPLSTNGDLYWKLPQESGVFSSKGFFNTPSGYLEIAVSCRNRSSRSLYLFPSGELYESGEGQ